MPRSPPGRAHRRNFLAGKVSAHGGLLVTTFRSRLFRAIDAPSGLAHDVRRWPKWYRSSSNHLDRDEGRCRPGRSDAEQSTLMCPI